METDKKNLKDNAGPSNKNKVGPSKGHAKTAPDAHAAPDAQIAQNTQALVDPQAELYALTELDTQASDNQELGLNSYLGIKPDILAPLMNEANNDVVLDIYPLSIDSSSVKRTPSNTSGVRTFIGKVPKMAKSITFKPFGVVNPTAVIL